MKIALIDDDVLFLKNLKKTIMERANFLNLLQIHVDTYNNPDNLLMNIENYQCVFLDVEMPLSCGLDLAKEIRCCNNEVMIVFISSFANYVFDSFDINPFTYILKSDLDTRGIKEIDRLIYQYYNEEKKYMIKNENLEFDLKQRNIEYIEKIENDCIFKYINEKIRLRISLKQLQEDLASYFIQINKSEVINFNYVKSIDKGKIVMKDERIFFISRRKVKVVVEAYFDFLRDFSLRKEL